MSSADELLRRGVLLERTTLSWNIVGVAVLAVAALRAHSVALGGFGLDSVIEIGASTVVLWELRGAGENREERALRLVGASFLVLAIYLLVQSVIILAVGYHARHSLLGLTWTGLTAVVMFGLARGKAHTGALLGNAVLRAEGRVTLIDGLLACAVVLGLVLNVAAGAWWADPSSGIVIALYGLREARVALVAGPGCRKNEHGQSRAGSGHENRLQARPRGTRSQGRRRAGRSG